MPATDAELLAEIAGLQKKTARRATDAELLGEIEALNGPQIGHAEAFGRGVKQGLTFNFGDELAGAAAQAGYGLQNWLDGRDGTDADLNAAYNQGRDEARRRDDAASDQHGVVNFAGNIVGGALPFALGAGAAAGGAGALKSATAKELALAGAKSGAWNGALMGVGDSKANDFGGWTGDSIKGAAAGALGGAIITPALAKGLPALAKTPQAVRDALSRFGQGEGAAMAKEIAWKGSERLPVAGGYIKAVREELAKRGEQAVTPRMIVEGERLAAADAAKAAKQAAREAAQAAKAGMRARKPPKLPAAAFEAEASPALAMDAPFAPPPPPAPSMPPNPYSLLGSRSPAPVELPPIPKPSPSPVEFARPAPVEFARPAPIDFTPPPMPKGRPAPVDMAALLTRPQAVDLPALPTPKARPAFVDMPPMPAMMPKASPVPSLEAARNILAQPRPVQIGSGPTASLAMQAGDVPVPQALLAKSPQEAAELLRRSAQRQGATEAGADFLRGKGIEISSGDMEALALKAAEQQTAIMRRQQAQAAAAAARQAKMLDEYVQTFIGREGVNQNIADIANVAGITRAELRDISERLGLGIADPVMEARAAAVAQKAIEAEQKAAADAAKKAARDAAKLEKQAAKAGMRKKKKP